MKDCKVWCYNSEELYRECKILYNMGEPLRSEWGKDILRAAMAYLWDCPLDGVGIYVSNNFVTFCSIKEYFLSNLKNELIPSFITVANSGFGDHIKKNIEDFGVCYEKSRGCQRKYSFCEAEKFFKYIYRLRKNDFTIDLDNDEIMDYLYNAINEIEGYYLLVDYSTKSAYISKLKHMYEQSGMKETNKGFEWDLEHLTD